MLKASQIQRMRKEARPADDRAPLIFGALADPRRYRIFRLLLRHRNLCVTEVAKVFKISVPAASQQLRILERTGLIRRERICQSVCYEIKPGNPLAGSILKYLK